MPRRRKANDDKSISAGSPRSRLSASNNTIDAPRDKSSTTNPRFVVGMRVCNRFPGYSELFWGAIAYTSLGKDGRTAVYGVCYDDGDREEYPEFEMLVGSSMPFVTLHFFGLILLCFSQDILNLTSKENEAANNIGSGSVHPLRSGSSSKHRTQNVPVPPRLSASCKNGGSASKSERVKPSFKNHVESTPDPSKLSKKTSHRQRKSSQPSMPAASVSEAHKAKKSRAISMPEKITQCRSKARATQEVKEKVVKEKVVHAESAALSSNDSSLKRIQLEKQEGGCTGLTASLNLIEAQNSPNPATKVVSMPEKSTQRASKASVVHKSAGKIVRAEFADSHEIRPRVNRNRSKNVEDGVLELRARLELQEGSTSKARTASVVGKTTQGAGKAKATRNAKDEVVGQKNAESNIKKELSVHLQRRKIQEEVLVDPEAASEVQESTISKVPVAFMPKTTSQRGAKRKTTRIVKAKSAAEESYSNHELESVVKRKKRENQDEVLSESFQATLSKCTELRSPRVARDKATSKKNRCGASTLTNVASSSDSVPTLETLEESTAAADILLSLTKSYDRATPEPAALPAADSAELEETPVEPTTDKETDSFESSVPENTSHEVSVPPLPPNEASKVWYYIDFHHRIQGPFATVLMQNWHRLGHFKDCPNLLVKSEGMMSFEPMSTSKLQRVFNSDCG